MEWLYFKLRRISSISFTIFADVTTSKESEIITAFDHKI